MPDLKNKIHKTCINTIRILSAEAIQKANSGHPGLPMGCAPIAHLLYSRIMTHNPANSTWINRDRFVLSAGHGSTMLYSVLHLSGYGISLEDIKNFRQWGSITPGHPEYGLTPGVEATTGPLGQGFANAVGMALVQSRFAKMFNRPNYDIIDHYIYVLAGDGDMMEGITHEAASFAGHNKLNNLIVFYDNNKITIDGSTKLSMSEDVGKRYEAYGWNVFYVSDVNDLEQLENAVFAAQKEKNAPSMIIVNTIIGYGSPNKQGKSSVHGSPLGAEELKLTKQTLGWNYEEPFFIPDEVKSFYEKVNIKGMHKNGEWDELFEKYSKAYPKEAESLAAAINCEYEENWELKLPEFTDYTKTIATRSASGKVLDILTEVIPNLIGGSADLTPSNNTRPGNVLDYSPESTEGRYIHFGIREHAMGAILNGMTLYGGVIAYGGTFLVFSDYMRPVIRIAALSKINPIFVFTHDSIGLGEDGPTHQPIEQLASLRAIPNSFVFRPADANEVRYVWEFAINNKKAPVSIILSRQNLPIFDRKKYTPACETLKGGYILKKTTKPDIILIGTGSEVSICLDAANRLELEGIKANVVSIPCMELFEQQDKRYINSVLPKAVKLRIAMEAGVKQGWDKYVGDEGEIISIETFGASAPYETIYEKYGLTAENIISKAKKMIKGKTN
ncbi:MAG: transketolase [bacterium]